MVDALLRHGADVNPPLLRDIPNYSRFATATHEYVGRTVEGPICGAVSGVRLRDPAVAIMLLERGANPNVLSRFGQTPLCVATENKDIGMVQLLLEHQADPNMQSHATPVSTMLSTPLLVCAKEHNDTRIAIMLLEHNADPNLVSVKKQTPLCEAVARGNLAMVQLLVDRGANLFTVNQAKRTAIELAEADPKLAEVAAYLRGAYEARMLAFSMGLHPRLGVGSPMHIYAADTGVKDDVMPMVGRFVRE